MSSITQIVLSIVLITPILCSHTRGNIQNNTLKIGRPTISYNLVKRNFLSKIITMATMILVCHVMKVFQNNQF